MELPESHGSQMGGEEGLTQFAGYRGVLVVVGSGGLHGYGV